MQAAYAVSRLRRCGAGIHHRLDREIGAHHHDHRLAQHVLAATTGEAVTCARVGHRQQQGAVADLGDLGVLAEQDPGEAALALDLLEHLRPEPAYVGDGELRDLRGLVGGVAGLPRSVSLRCSEVATAPSWLAGSGHRVSGPGPAGSLQAAGRVSRLSGHGAGVACDELRPARVELRRCPSDTDPPLEAVESRVHAAIVDVGTRQAAPARTSAPDAAGGR